MNFYRIEQVDGFEIVRCNSELTRVPEIILNRARAHLEKRKIKVSLIEFLGSAINEKIIRDQKK